MTVTFKDNAVDQKLVDLTVKTRRATYEIPGIHPDWVARFRNMSVDRVLDILTAKRPVIVIPQIPARARA